MQLLARADIGYSELWVVTREVQPTKAPQCIVAIAYNLCRDAFDDLIGDQIGQRVFFST